MDPSVVVWCFALAILIIAGYWGLKFYDSFRNNKSHQADWQSLALTNQLEFVSATSSKDQAYLKGEYRGYHLKLTIMQEQDWYGRYNGVSITNITLAKKMESKFLPKAETAAQSLTFEEAVRNFTSLDTRYPLTGKVGALPGGQQIYYRQDGIEPDIEKLQYLFDLLTNLATAYPLLVASGGKAVPFLQKNAKLALIRGNNCLRPITVQVLQEIIPDTLQLKQQISQLLCAQCLARCEAHQIDLLPLESATYYGCRICGESQKLMTGAKAVVAVLDSHMEGELAQNTSVLCVNWLVRRTLFDFESVEIIQASDEDIERFAVQVGNDTDQLRQERYKDMKCRVMSDCKISENTMRILYRTFGQVETKEVGRKQP